MSLFPKKWSIPLSDLLFNKYYIICKKFSDKVGTRSPTGISTLFAEVQTYNTMMLVLRVKSATRTVKHIFALKE